MGKEETSAINTPLLQQFYRANHALMLVRTLAHPYGVRTLRAEMERYDFTNTETTETLLFMLERNMLVVANPDTTREVRYGLPDKSVTPHYSFGATPSGVRLTASQIFDDDFGRPSIELRLEGKNGRAGKVYTFPYEALLSLIAQAHDVRNFIEQYILA